MKHKWLEECLEWCYIFVAPLIALVIITVLFTLMTAVMR